MAEEMTRKVLKVFGVAVTDFEDQAHTLAARARDLGARGGPSAEVAGLLAEVVRSTAEINRRWMEVTTLIFEAQARLHGDVARALGQEAGGQR